MDLSSNTATQLQQKAPASDVGGSSIKLLC